MALCPLCTGGLRSRVYPERLCPMCLGEGFIYDDAQERLLKAQREAGPVPVVSPPGAWRTTADAAT